MKNRFITVVLTAALTSLGTFYLAARYTQQHQPFVTYNSRPPVSFTGFGGGPSPSVDFEAAASSSVPAVVHIKTTMKTTRISAEEEMLNQLFQNPWQGSQQYGGRPIGESGSGVVFSPDGYIVTNNHVVAGADNVTVTFNDRLTMNAKVIGTDPSTDLAVIKVDETNLPYMEFGNSDDVHLGQWVLAVGYPFSLDATVTAGIVSAKARSIGINATNSNSPIESFIQTDAAVNPGNSGGALVNTNGQLIGINSAIATTSNTYAGIGYAIPSNIVRKVVNDIVQYGSYQRGYMGIMYLDRKRATPEQVTALGLDRNDGVYVESVTPGGGAAHSGLKKGDFIVAVNGAAVHTEPEMVEQIARYKPGDNIAVTYTRGGTQYNTTIELKNSAGNTSVLREEEMTTLLGATLRPLTKTELSTYRLKGGVVVSQINKGELADQTNMRPGFIITGINDQSVMSLSDLEQITQSIGEDGFHIAGLYPGSRGMYYYSINLKKKEEGIR